MIHLCVLGLVASLLVSAEAHLPTEGIVGGDTADNNQFPYQVSLQHYDSNFCGGGIIGDQFILTAAHCVVKKDGEMDRRRMFVVAGTSDLSGTSGAVRVEVCKVYVPTGFQRQLGNNLDDVAVLKLTEPLGLQQHSNLKALQLPRNTLRTYAHATAKISGFGWDWAEVLPGDKERGGHTDTKLRFAEAEVLSNVECQRNYVHDLISEKQICARTKQRFISKSSGVCSGDSGGPLVHAGTTIVGVVSTGPIGCNEEVRAAIYTRVSSYLDFIDNAINDKQTSDIRASELMPTFFVSPDGMFVFSRPSCSNWNSSHKSFSNLFFNWF